MSQNNSDESSKNSKPIMRQSRNESRSIDAREHTPSRSPVSEMNGKEVSRSSINNFLNSGKPIKKTSEITPTKNKLVSGEPNKNYSPLKEFRSNSVVVNDTDISPHNFDLVEFKEVESELINEEKARVEEDSKNNTDDKKTTFLKRFKLERGERLVDSFACAVAIKILLQGRLYITNQRLCFHSFFNNKLLFFGKDTKITIPLDDIVSLEKRVNAIFFDNSIAVITKNDKETFFTSFLMRDKAFEVIKIQLEKDKKHVDSEQTNSLLKRTFVRFSPNKNNKNSSDDELEDEEEEEEDQGNFYEDSNIITLSGEKAKAEITVGDLDGTKLESS